MLAGSVVFLVAVAVFIYTEQTKVGKMGGGSIFELVRATSIIIAQ
jgi:hypothetical protein